MLSFFLFGRVAVRTAAAEIGVGREHLEAGGQQFGDRVGIAFQSDVIDMPAFCAEEVGVGMCVAIEAGFPFVDREHSCRSLFRQQS